MPSQSIFKHSAKLMIATALCGAIGIGAVYASGKLTEKQIVDFYEYSEGVTKRGGSDVVEYVKKYVDESAIIKQDITFNIINQPSQKSSVEMSKKEFLDTAMQSAEQSNRQVMSVETTVKSTDIASGGKTAHVVTTSKIETLTDMQTPGGAVRVKSTMNAECKDDLAWDQNVGLRVTGSVCVSDVLVEHGSPAQ